MARLCSLVLCLCLTGPALAGPIELVKDIEIDGIPYHPPGWTLPPDIHGGVPFGLTATAGDRLVFLANDRSGGFEPWISDGTEAGTELILDACPGDCGSDFLFAARLEDSVLWRAEDALWTSDGTPAGTRQRSPVDPSLEPILGTASLNGEYFVLSRTNALVRLRGAELPPEPVRPICQDSGARDCVGFVRQQGETIFLGEGFRLSATGERLFRLWASDGTSLGTSLIYEASCSFDFPILAAGAGDGRTFLSVPCYEASSSFHGPLLLTDGTPGGTEFLAGASSALGSAPHTAPVALGDSIFVAARDTLWKIRSGQAEVAGGFQDDIEEIVVLGESLILIVDRFHEPDQIWHVDPHSFEATQLGLAAYESPYFIDSIQRPVVWGKTLFFGGFSEEAGAELWMTDGTPRGTRLVQDLNPGPDGSRPTELTLVGSKLFFSAWTEEVDAELFMVDLEKFLCPSLTNLFQSPEACAARNEDLRPMLPKTASSEKKPPETELQPHRFFRRATTRDRP